MSKKKYLLFAGHKFYPEGGADDFRMRGTTKQCKEWFQKNAECIADESANYVDNWGQIVDAKTMQIAEVGSVKYLVLPDGKAKLEKAGIAKWVRYEYNITGE